jgi:ABC-type phosphate/phosphonate transport system substrate-binding protein
MKDKTFFMVIAAIATLGIVISFLLLYNMLPFPGQSGFGNEDSNSDSDGKEIVYIGVVSRFPPPIIYQGYQPIADYLTNSTDFRFELKLFPTYKDTVDSLVAGEISAAFLGSQIYIESRETLEIIPILKPLNSKGEPFHSSVIITAASNESDEIDLEGKTVALPSEEAFASNWFNNVFLPQSASKPELITIFNYHHSVLFEVLKGNFDYGVVKDRVAMEYQEKGIKVVYTSRKIPSSPIVVSRNYNKLIIDQFVAALLSVNENGKLAEISKDWDYEFVNGFARANEEDYSELSDYIREQFKE